jgi:hypothetical protein
MAIHTLRTQSLINCQISDLPVRDGSVSLFRHVHFVSCLPFKCTLL